MNYNVDNYKLLQENIFCFAFYINKSFTQKYP